MLINIKEIHITIKSIVNVHLTVVDRIACGRLWVPAPILVGYVLLDL